MALPQGISRVNFLSHSAATEGLVHSVALKGGYQEFTSLTERNQIPLFLNESVTYTGFTISDDVLSSGRRRVGMLVFIIETQKFYNLIPVGFFGNGGSLGETEWLALPEWERALRIDPSGTYCSEGATPVNGFTAVQKTASDISISSDANGCWIETAIGVDGTSGADGTSGINGTSGISGTSGNDGNHGTSGVDGASASNILDFWSEGSASYKVGPNSDYESASNNSNPDLYLTKGETYTFTRSTAGHPLNINISAGIVSGSLSVTQGADVVWKVPMDANATYTYVCTSHPSMTGTIHVCSCTGEDVDTPSPTATPVPEPTNVPETPIPAPTATPIPDPTATAIPDPTATPVPDPTATSAPEPTPTATANEAKVFGVNVADGLGDVDNKDQCESPKHNVWSNTISSAAGAKIGDTLFSDSALSVIFVGGNRWYDLGESGNVEVKIRVRDGIINAVADCPSEEPIIPTATPEPEITPTPIPDPTATRVPDPTATPVPDPTATRPVDPTATPASEPKYTTTYNISSTLEGISIRGGDADGSNEGESINALNISEREENAPFVEYLWLTKLEGEFADASEVTIQSNVGDPVRIIEKFVTREFMRIKISGNQESGNRAGTLQFEASVKGEE